MERPAKFVPHLLWLVHRFMLNQAELGVLVFGVPKKESTKGNCDSPANWLFLPK